MMIGLDSLNTSAFLLVFVVALLVGTAVILALQALLAYRFRNLYACPAELKEDAALPHTGIALCVRGSDSTLEACLEGLLHQDYPSFEIRIIVDSYEDPAFPLVKSLIARHPSRRISVEKLNLVDNLCGLKNAALLQAINGFSPACQVYAWLDSDIAPQKNWLRSLISNLEEGSFPVACGIRWFCPPVSSLGAVVRHVWNTAALTQQLAYGIGWGGSIVCCRSFFEKANLRSLLGKSMFEDTLIAQVVVDHGGKLRFVPQATMCNNESASVSWCRGFFTRQLLGVRLYHKKWNHVLFSGLLSALALIGFASLAVVWDILEKRVISPILLLTALMGILLVLAMLLRQLETNVMSFLYTDEREFSGKTPLRRVFLAIPIAYVIWLVCLVETSMARSVTWRGILYHVNGPFDISRKNYSAFTENISENSSI